MAEATRLTSTLTLSTAQLPGGVDSQNARNSADGFQSHNMYLNAKMEYHGLSILIYTFSKLMLPNQAAPFPCRLLAPPFLAILKERSAPRPALSGARAARRFDFSTSRLCSGFSVGVILSNAATVPPTLCLYRLMQGDVATPRGEAERIPKNGVTTPGVAPVPARPVLPPARPCWGGSETRPCRTSTLPAAGARTPPRSGPLGATPGVGRTSPAGPGHLDGNVATEAGRGFLRRRRRLEPSCSSQPLAHAHPAPFPKVCRPRAKVGVRARSGRQAGGGPTAQWFP